MNEKKINYLNKIVDVTFFLIYILITYHSLCILGFNEWVKLSPEKIYVNLFPNIVNIILIYYILFIFAVFFHELGHLIVGLILKLKFVSFNFCGFKIKFKNNKLVLSFGKSLSDFVGSCNMNFEQNKNYNKYSIVVYFMGGIIFNLILSLLFIILLFFIDNCYFNIISLFFITLNINLVISNSIPITLKSGNTSDMLKTIYCSKDPNYLKTINNLTIILSLLENNIEYKDMDENLFMKPNKFIYPSDVTMAHFYIAYLTSKEKYNMVVNYSKKVLNDAKELLKEYDINLLKVQLINCAFDDVKNYDIIIDCWDEKFDKYMTLMGEKRPSYLYINYIYLLKVMKDKEKAKNLLDKFYMLENKYINKDDFNYTKNRILEINKNEK